MNNNNNKIYSAKVVKATNSIPFEVVEFLKSEYKNFQYIEWYINTNRMESFVDEWLISMGAKQSETIIILLDFRQQY